MTVPVTKSQTAVKLNVLYEIPRYHLIIDVAITKLNLYLFTEMKLMINISQVVFP